MEKLVGYVIWDKEDNSFSYNYSGGVWKSATIPNKQVDNKTTFVVPVYAKIK